MVKYENQQIEEVKADRGCWCKNDKYLKLLFYRIIQQLLFSMKNQIGKEIIVKVVQCILQSRIDVRKQQIRTFDKVNKQINKNRQEAFESNINHFLDNLLISELYGIRKKLQSFKNFFSVRIGFKLVKKKKSTIILAELWQIDLQQFCQIDLENQKQEFVMVSTSIEELLLFLNRQPLFSQYQKNSQLKSEYFLDYEIDVHESKNVKNLDNILNLSNKYAKERTCKSLSIGIVSYFLPKFDKLTSSCKNNFLFHQNKEEGRMDSERKTIDCTEEIQMEKEQEDERMKKQGSSRKVSLYEFFDHDLDFVFLASDDESFKKKQKNYMKEIEIEEDSQQFQLLMITKEEEFIQENKSILSQLASNQLSYFQI